MGLGGGMDGGAWRGCMDPDTEDERRGEERIVTGRAGRDETRPMGCALACRYPDS